MSEKVTAAEAERAAALREPVPLDRYQRKVASALTSLFEHESTEEQEIDLATSRLVVLSDHHRGARDGADDFLRCERAYAGALAYYFETGYSLFVLGDVDELWECRPEEVVEAYAETLELEAEFHRAGRYERFWGNHDDHWQAPAEVEKHLDRFFPGLLVREALKLRVVRDGEDLGVILLAHGHQGTVESDRFSWFSRIVVRYLWRPVQRRLDMPSTTPAKEFHLRQRHDAAMFSWARSYEARPVLIAGHTHRPVFWTSRPPDKDELEADLRQQLEELRASPDADVEAVARLRARLESVRARRRRGEPPPVAIDPPCYFNTGCCSFGDGDVTGIEIVEGQIRLVRWPDDDGEPLPKLLVSADLGEILAAVRGAEERALAAS